MFSLDVVELLLEGLGDIIRDIVADYVIDEFTLGVKDDVSELVEVHDHHFRLVTL